MNSSLLYIPYLTIPFLLLQLFLDLARCSGVIFLPFLTICIIQPLIYPSTQP
jgi:hypothetical protein